MGRDGDNVWRNRRALVAETIRRSSPHVVGLQEALTEQIEFLESELPGYRWLGVDRGLNGGRGLSESTPIFYRYDELSRSSRGPSGSRTPQTLPREEGGPPGSSLGLDSITWRPEVRSTSSTPTSASGGVSGSSTQ